MSAYVAKLRAETEREQARYEAAQAEKHRAVANEAREKLVALETRLARLLATIPPEVQGEGLSLMALQTQLRARGRGHSRCHVGELGEALRKLGFERRRAWRGAKEFKALWFPAQACGERRRNRSP